MTASSNPNGNASSGAARVHSNGARLRDALHAIGDQLPARCGPTSGSLLQSVFFVLEGNTYFKSMTIQDGYGRGPSLTELARKVHVNEKTMRTAMLVVLRWGLLKVNNTDGRHNHHEAHRPTRLMEWDLEVLEREAKWLSFRFEEPGVKSYRASHPVTSPPNGASPKSSYRVSHPVRGKLPGLTPGSGYKALKEGPEVIDFNNALPADLSLDVLVTHGVNGSTSGATTTPDEILSTAKADAARDGGPSTTNDSPTITLGDEVPFTQWPDRERAAWKAGKKRAPAPLVDGGALWPTRWGPFVIVDFHYPKPYRLAIESIAEIDAFMDKHLADDVQGWFLRHGSESVRRSRWGPLLRHVVIREAHCRFSLRVA